jgi:serine/threonine protein kinase
MNEAAPLRDCLSVTDAARFVATDPGSAERNAALEHIDSCSRCRELVAEVVRSPGRARDVVAAGTCQPGEVLGDRYEIRTVLGAGGMGEVYEAHDRLLRDTVALKTIVCTALDDAAAIERLRREVLLARKVTHPNVCRVLEFGMHWRQDGARREPVPFFTMELLRGETLARFLARRGHPGPEEARGLALQIIDGLAAVHAADILHRDLKPENIFLVQEAGGPRAVIMDLGLARPTRVATSLSTLSAASRVAGTPGYMSPEQHRGERLTPASDIYALGVVLHELMGTKSPWEAAIARCLSPLPEHRFANVGELRRALVKPRPKGRRLALGLAALAGAAAITGVVVTRRPSRKEPVATAPPVVASQPVAPPPTEVAPTPPAAAVPAPPPASSSPHPPAGVVMAPPRRHRAPRTSAPAGDTVPAAKATPAETPSAPEPAPPPKKRSIVFKAF